MFELVILSKLRNTQTIQHKQDESINISSYIIYTLIDQKKKQLIKGTLRSE